MAARSSSSHQAASSVMRAATSLPNPNAVRPSRYSRPMSVRKNGAVEHDVVGGDGDPQADSDHGCDPVARVQHPTRAGGGGHRGHREERSEVARPGHQCGVVDDAVAVGVCELMWVLEAVNGEVVHADAGHFGHRVGNDLLDQFERGRAAVAALIAVISRNPTP